MLRKIITYFLIISVVAPILSALPWGANKSYAETTTTTYKNKSGYTVSRQETTSSSGKVTIFEDYYDKNDTLHRRKTEYNSGETSTAKWNEIAGRGGDYSEAVSDSGASGDTTSTSNDGNTTTGNNNNASGNNGVNQDHNGETYNPCNLFWKGSMGECISYITAWVMYFPFRVTNYITAMAGSLFNSSIGFSLSSESFPTGKGSMIATGWTITRDLVNLFFIFILLYIAISTILQYGSFSKEVLVKLIVAAVLINFSLMITKVIIDSSHVLAWEFYNKIDVTNEKKAGDGTQFADIKDEMKIKGFETKNLANVFLAGFNPQKLIIPSTNSTGNPETLLNKVNSNGGNIKATWFQLILIMTLATVLNLVAAFILFAGAILFVIRVVVLWFVLILSPLAFAGMVVPSFQKYSSQWWDKLISQAFFAPAFLFLFYLVTELINSGFLKSVISAANNTATGKVLFLETGSTIVVFFHFLIVGVLMVGCLWIAQQMGAYGADGFMKSFNKGKDWAQKKARSIPGSAYGGMKSGTRRWYAPAAEGFATGEGKMGKVGEFARRIPIVGSMLTKRAADIAAKSRAIIEEKQKKYAGYTPKEMGKIVEAGGIFDKKFRPFETAARTKVLEDKKALKDADPEIILQAIKTMESIGNVKGANDLKKLRADLAGGVIITPATARPLSAAIADAIKKAVGYQKPEDIIELKFENNFFDKTGGVYDNPAAEQIVKGMLENYKAGHIRKLFERGDVFYDELVHKITSLVPAPLPGQKVKATDVAAEVRRLFSNKGLATALESGNLNDLLGLG